MRILEIIKGRLKRFHGEEEGAVFLLLLAGVLILLMVALTIFDTGVAAHDKVATQVSADTAAYSHAVVKARSMNTIVYANIIKRMYYSYLAVYTNAWVAVAAYTVIELVICIASWGSSCDRFVKILALAIAEGIEAASPNYKTLSSFSDEINGLESYQVYMSDITPWWAYMEGLLRGSENGAMLTTSWPPPPTVADEVKDVVFGLAGIVDGLFGLSITDLLPPVSNHTDLLPIARRDLAGDGHGMSKYCSEYRFSYEHAVHGIQSVVNSDMIGLQIAMVAAYLIAIPGCAAADASYGPQYFDWRIRDALTKDKLLWAKSTGNISIAYRPHEGRNDDEGERKKYGYLKKEYKKNYLYQNEGYFAMARAEIVYAPVFDVQDDSFLSNDFMSSLIGNGENPDMWSPRWKARGRAFLLPGEQLGSSIPGAAASLGTVVDDSVPLLALSSLIGLGSDSFGFNSGLHDLIFLVHTGHTAGVTGAGFSSANLGGIPK